MASQNYPSVDDSFAFMGKPLNLEVREYTLKIAKTVIGLDTAKAYDCIQGMCEQYERDNPYAAQKHSLKYVDLTGHYMLMAAIASAYIQTK